MIFLFPLNLISISNPRKPKKEWVPLSVILVLAIILVLIFILFSISNFVFFSIFILKIILAFLFFIFSLVYNQWRLLHPPGFWSSWPNIFVKWFMGMFSGSRNLMMIVTIFYLHRMTLKLKVIDLVHGCGATPWPSLSGHWVAPKAFIHWFSNSLPQNT